MIFSFTKNARYRLKIDLNSDIMKLKKLVIFILVIASTLIFAVGCNTSVTYDTTGMAKVVFHLEGGVYRNCEGTVNYYYELEPGATRRIRNPNADKKNDTVSGRFANSGVSRVGYTLEGWFKSKTEENDEIVYSDEWDFDNDTITNDGVELYAKWTPNVVYTYSICCADVNGVPELDDDGNYIKVGEYPVSEGDKFTGDFAGFRYERIGYTAVQYEGQWYFDKDGNPWDSDFTHPGGKTSTAIPVFVRYEPGKFVTVGTQSELLDYINGAQWAATDPVGIRLTADIDLGGAAIPGFQNFRGVFDGQNHKISNFSLSYNNTKAYLDSDEAKADSELPGEDKQLRISLFGELRGRRDMFTGEYVITEVKNVTFENFTIEISVPYENTHETYIAPLCVKAINASVSNVTMTGTVREKSFHENYRKDRYYEIALDNNGKFLPLPKVANDPNNVNSTFTNVNLLGMAYEPLQD